MYEYPYDKDQKEYIPAIKTDVMETWRKFGFVPPSTEDERCIIKHNFFKSFGAL